MTDTFKALVLDETDGKTTRAFVQLSDDALPEGDVLLEVQYSSLNYKDALAITGRGRIVKKFPIIPGIDSVGTVLESSAPDYAPGDAVILTGWDVGERYWGGMSQRQRVQSEWLVPLPDCLSALEAMTLGTAGFTAMLCIMALEEAGVTPGSGPVLVTGASGGVGSVAVAALSQLGFEVWALSGKSGSEDYLRGLGASGFVSRTEMEIPPRALEKQRWAGAVDTVGSKILARVLAELKHGATVAACGLAGGADLPTTVMPFILRGIRLQGVESVKCPFERRATAWRRLGDTLPKAALAQIGQTIALDETIEWSEKLLAGQVTGRLIVKLN